MKKRKLTPIGSELLAFLERSGMNQSALALRLNVHRSTLSLWINGKRKPARHSIPELSEVTGVPKERWL